MESWDSIISRYEIMTLHLQAIYVVSSIATKNTILEPASPSVTSKG